MRNPSPGSCLGGSGRPGEATVPTGEALIVTIRRTPAARIAVMIAWMPGAAIPASALLCGPRADSTASAPAIADSRRCGYGLARSTATIRAGRPAGTSWGSLAGLRATAVTSWPAARAWLRSWRPTPPVAAMMASFMVSSLVEQVSGPRGRPAPGAPAGCAGMGSGWRSAGCIGEDHRPVLQPPLAGEPEVEPGGVHVLEQPPPCAGHDGPDPEVELVDQVVSYERVVQAAGAVFDEVLARLVLQPGDRAGWVGPEQGGIPCRLGQRSGCDVLGHG